MNKSKCKKCKKWHPQLKDIKCWFTYQCHEGCKCNKAIIGVVTGHDLKVNKIQKGIVYLDKKDVEYVTKIMTFNKQKLEKRNE